MKELIYQEVMNEKYNRQKQIPNLETHVSGGAIHIGKVSPGCEWCFTGESAPFSGGGVQIGAKCMSNCSVCYYDRNRPEQTREQTNSIITDHFFYKLTGNKYKAFAYQSSGETLLYLNDLEKVMAIHKAMDKEQGRQMYHHLYTNGIPASPDVLQRLKDGGVHELRFHLTASSSSKKVIQNMYNAAKMGFAITIEEPSYPPNREEIFNLLPILEDVGGKHLDMVEVQLTESNMPDIEREYPEGRYFRDHYPQLYDEGLTYDIMEEVNKKGYHFSVMDCNSGVERYRQNKARVGFDIKTLEGLSAPFPYEEPKIDLEWWYKENQEKLAQRIVDGTAFTDMVYVNKIPEDL